MNNNFKVGFISIVGKPNTGKSTLLNCLAQYKVAITTPKPQTTRFNIKAIVNNKNSQMIFIDTPGIHKAKNKLGKYMNENAIQSIPDSDVVVYIVDATKPKLDDINENIIKSLKDSRSKKIMCITKIDLVRKEEILKIIEQYSKEISFEAIIPISTFKKDGIDILIEKIEGMLPIGEPLYLEDEITDMTEREIVEETIREKALSYLNEEIPHGIMVKVEKMRERTDKEIYDIEVNIYVDKKSHKGIVIGKDGLMLKKIGESSRRDIEKMLGMKTNLQLWVKIAADWREQDKYLNSFKNKNK